MRIKKLTVNHYNYPIVQKEFELSWMLVSKERNVTQKSYQIQIFDKNEVIYDTKETFSEQQSFIYIQPKLESKKEYRARVIVVDNYNNKATKTVKFRTAYLENPFPNSLWISSPFERNKEQLFVYGIENHPVRFEKEFDVQGKVKRAILYSSCYGIYIPYLEKQKIGNGFFHPDFTSYSKRLNYQAFELSSMIKQGVNHLEFEVANGWYFCAQTEVPGAERIDNYSIIYELEIEYEDGRKESIYSDGNETVRKTNIIFSDIFQGERIDYNYQENLKEKVIIKDYTKENLLPQPIPYVVEEERLSPIRIYKSIKNELIVDFGKIITGKINAKIKLPKGNEVSFTHSEMVDSDGTFFRAFSHAQKVSAISNGEEMTIESKFTFLGFRYVLVEGVETISADDIVAISMTTEKENKSSFKCSDERFNQLYKNIRNSQKNNMLSIPTDCPTREKAGWTGDVLVYSKAAIQNEEMTPFFTSWLDNLSSDQDKNGAIPLISPYTKLYDMVSKKTFSNYALEKTNNGYDAILPKDGDVYSNEVQGIAGWSDAIVFVCYDLYKLTGNKKILERYYDSMKKWCDYIINESKTKVGSSLPKKYDQYLWNTGFHFGEWLVPGRPSGFDDCPSTGIYVAPFYGYYSNYLFSEIARVLEKEEDYVKHLNYVKNCKDAIINGLFDNDILPKEFQGLYVLAFAFNLVPDKYFEQFKNRLVQLVEEKGCLQTGFLPTPYLLDVLIKLDRKDLAKKILYQDESPSWLYEIKHGATAIWEEWEAVDENNHPKKVSFDHYAFGIIDDWIIRNIAGITTNNSFHHITISPDTYFGFNKVNRTLLTEYGQIKVYYNSKLLKVTIPCNTTATIKWNNNTYEVGSGTYSFR